MSKRKTETRLADGSSQKGNQVGDSGGAPSLSREEIAEKAIQSGVDFAQSQIEFLLASDRPGEVVIVYSGIEGGTVTEGVFHWIFERLRVDDPRSLEPAQPPTDDSDAEAVYELAADHGIRLRLTRFKPDSNEGARERFLQVQVDAEKS